MKMKMNLTPEKAYKYYDEHDFIVISMAMNMDVTKEELTKILQIVCEFGTQGTDSND